MEDKILFIIGSPRSGSTLLQRMVGSHSKIFTHPEPHLMTPLAHLGYFHNVDKAPYDHINAAKAMREFVDGLPNKEQDFVDACRAYSDMLYGRMLSTGKGELFLDKTPAYALITPFLTRLYPKARYIVLARHPLAILSSYANSFFEGSYEEAYRFNPILDRYVPAIAGFLRETQTPKLHVRYEDLVQKPEAELARIFGFLGLEDEPGAVNYGAHDHIKKSFGDPNVEQHSRPTTESLDKWADDLAADPKKLEFARNVASGLSPEDLKTWGYDPARLFDDVERVQATGQAGQKEKGLPKLNAYRIQRKVLLKLRKNIHQNQLGKLVQGVRYYCDVLLRD
jgi:hypothetical protein